MLFSDIKSIIDISESTVNESLERASYVVMHSNDKTKEKLKAITTEKSKENQESPTNRGILYFSNLAINANVTYSQRKSRVKTLYSNLSTRSRATRLGWRNSTPHFILLD